MLMKKTSLCIAFVIAVFCSVAQSSAVKEIDQLNTHQALAPLRFLASDELMGRSTTRPEIHVAARYIGEQFRSFGLREVAGTKDYFQSFELPFITAPAGGSFVVGSKTYFIGKDFIQARGLAIELTAPAVFAGFGSPADLGDLDVRGKIVVVNMGENDSTPVRRSGPSRNAKQKLLQEKGALALVERYWQPTPDWEIVKHYYGGQRMQDALDSLLPVFLVYDPGGAIASEVKSSATVSVLVTGNHLMQVPAENVMGWVKGTDPQLKDQFVVLSAHYDHIGVAPVPKMEEGKLDSIYNGARDNAIGVTGVINAARYFSLHPAKRSILFIAFTGEEMGMLGSRYFAAHPNIELKKLIYNLNIDNGGYNDTSRVNVIGLGRTTADADMKKACAAYDLDLFGDPAPEQNFFDRSDNASLAAKGIPAPSFGMGVKGLDESIMKRYHQLSDEIADIDLAYIVKYMKTYILAAKFIADNPAQPRWKEGDKYEAAWKGLYLR